VLEDVDALRVRAHAANVVLRRIYLHVDQVGKHVLRLHLIGHADLFTTEEHPVAVLLFVVVLVLWLVLGRLATHVVSIAFLNLGFVVFVGGDGADARALLLFLLLLERLLPGGLFLGLLRLLGQLGFLNLHIAWLDRHQRVLVIVSYTTIQIFLTEGWVERINCLLRGRHWGRLRGRAFVFLVLVVVREFRILNKHVRVVHCVVVVIELHHAAHERIIGLHVLFHVALVVVFNWNHHRLFQQVSRLDDAVGEELTEVRHSLDALELLIGLLAGFDVGVARAVLYGVTNFFTTEAAHILFALLAVAIVVVVHVVLIIFIILGLVRAELTATRVLARLTAAPPHLTAVLALMNRTTPLEVLFFVVLLSALFASEQTRVELALPLDQLLNSQLGLLLVHGQLLARFLQIENLVEVVVVIFV